MSPEGRLTTRLSGRGAIQISFDNVLEGFYGPIFFKLDHSKLVRHPVDFLTPKEMIAGIIKLGAPHFTAQTMVIELHKARLLRR